MKARFVTVCRAYLSLWIKQNNADGHEVNHVENAIRTLNVKSNVKNIPVFDWIFFPFQPKLSPRFHLIHAARLN